MRRYVVCRAWDHIDPDGDVLECRFVYDRRENELVHVDVRYGRRWIRASRDEWTDIEDSILHSNSDHLDEPDGEMAATISLPSWARRKSEGVIRIPRRPNDTVKLQLSFDGI